MSVKKAAEKQKSNVQKVQYLRQARDVADVRCDVYRYGLIKALKEMYNPTTWVVTELRQTFDRFVDAVVDLTDCQQQFDAVRPRRTLVRRRNPQ